MAGGGERRRDADGASGLWRRLAWFVVLWLAGVTALGVTAAAIRFAIRL